MKLPASAFGQWPCILVLPLLIFSLATGCSSDDDGDVVSLPGTIPDQLNYQLWQGTNAQLTLTQNPKATVTSTLLTGTYNRISQAFTLDAVGIAMQASAGDFLADLDAALEGGVSFSDYQLHVTTAATWIGDGDPTSGVFEIVSSDEAHKIRVSVNNTLPGVDIGYYPNGLLTDNVSLTWQEFGEVFDNPGDTPYAAIASFGYRLLRIMYEQAGLVIQALELIGENDVVLEEVGPIAEDCDTFPPYDSVPAVPNPGTSTLYWSDTNTDNSVNPGDSFLLYLSDCWDDDATDLFDTLYSGTVEFLNYTEVVNGSVITRIGFEPGSGPGGVMYTGLEITETEDNLTAILIGDTITLNGGFNMVFTSQ